MSSKNQAYARVAVLWNDTVWSEKEVGASSPVTVGEDPTNTLVVPAAGGVGGSHEVLSPDSGGFTLNLTHEMTGRVTLGGELLTVAEARKKKGSSFAISGTDWAVLDLGPYAVFVQSVERGETITKTPFAANMEQSMLACMLIAVVLHLGFLIAAFVFWSDDPVLTELDLSDRFMKIIVEEPPPEIEEEEEEESIDEDVGKKAGGEEGKFGEEDKIEKSKVPKRDGEMVDKIKDVGIHKALGSDLLGRGPLQNVFGDKTGFDSKLNAAMAGAGDNLIVGAGSGGMGLRGTGGGGGGQGFGRIHGMGRIDTGGGRGTRARLGGKKKRKKKLVRRGKGNVAGFCKEKDITRVVSSRQRGITYCYEKELARNPELQGKVTMKWRIGLDGKVSKVLVASSTLKNKTVEGCMKRSIQRWRFPKPEGGMCQIQFPFVFSAGL